MLLEIIVIDDEEWGIFRFVFNFCVLWFEDL